VDEVAELAEAGSLDDAKPRPAAPKVTKGKKVDLPADPKPVEEPTASPSPFEKASAPQPVEFDYGVCPIPGKLFGQRWEDMPEGTLTFAFTLTHESLEDGHRAAIQNALNALSGNDAG
jgi:hypothetical protein